MFRDRREAQRAGAERADGAAGLENIGFTLPARVKKGQLHGDDFARRRLNGGDHTGEGFPARIGIARQKPDGRGRRLRKAARAKIGFGGSAGDGLGCAPEVEGVGCRRLALCARRRGGRVEARRPVHIELVDRGANVAGIAARKAIVDQSAVAITDGERRAQISPALAMARDRATTQKAPACGMASQDSRDCLRFDLHGSTFCIRRSGKESRPRLGESACAGGGCLGRRGWMGGGEGWGGVKGNAARGSPWASA